MREYTIAGNLVTVEKSSFSLTDKVNERTTCTLVVIEPDFEIIPGMEVAVTENGTDVFRGTVEQPHSYGDKVKYVRVSCVDYSQLIDKRVVYDTFVNTPAGDIVRALIAHFFAEEGITEGDILDGPEIAAAVFNYDNGNVAMNYIRDVTGYNWTIDNDKRLHFFDRASYTAPFGLTDDSLNYQGLTVQRPRGQYRNRQYVRAGRDITIPQELERPTPKPDGVSRTFVTRFPLAEKPQIFIDGVEVPSEDIGVNGLDRDKKWYFSYSSNNITQDFSEEPLSTEVLEITYRGLYPIIVVADNPTEIETMQQNEGGTGIYESVVEEQNINTREAAFEFAQGKLEKYGFIPRIVEYNTYQHGLKAGQLQPIQNTKHNLDGDFLIESVTARDDRGMTLYTVRALDGSSLGGWEQLFKDLIRGQRRLVIRENEVLVLLVNLPERHGWKEQISTPEPETVPESSTWAEQVEAAAFACPVPSEELYPSETLYPC